MSQSLHQGRASDHCSFAGNIKEQEVQDVYSPYSMYPS